MPLIRRGTGSQLCWIVFYDKPSWAQEAQSPVNVLHICAVMLPLPSGRGFLSQPAMQRRTWSAIGLLTVQRQ